MAKSQDKWPLILVDRGVTMRIYHIRQVKRGRRYETFILYWRVAKGRAGIRRKAFADLEHAKTRAAIEVTAILNGRAAAVAMTPEDAATLSAARRLAAEIGKPLLACLEEHKAAHAQLAGRATLTEATRHWSEHHGAPAVPATPEEVWKEFAAEKRREGCSEFYLQPLASRFARFANAFELPFHRITAALFDEWLRRTARSPKDRNHKRDAIVTVARWAQARGHLPDDRPLELGRVPKLRIRDGREVQIYSPAALCKILFAGEHSPAALDAALVPFVTIAAFAGIRTRELQRLDWSNVRLAERIIVVPALRAKTATRRVVPIADNLAAWLAPHAAARGPVVTVRNPRYLLRQRLDEVAVPPHRNALRHSFISYRLPVVKSAAEVALEAGNSPAMVFRHYREVTTPSAVAGWWNIFPASEAAAIGPA